MSCRLAPIWTLALLSLAGPTVFAQNPFPQDLVPTRTALGRLGLERQWVAVVPLFENERLLRISRSEDLFFAQTSNGSIHTLDVVSGKLIWSANLGGYTPHPQPLASNSYAVYGSTGGLLVALERRSGRTIWKQPITAVPTSGMACNDDHLVVGTAAGRVIAYQLREKDPKGKKPVKILLAPRETWNWQTGGQVHTLPLPADHVTAFGSSDGRVYVVMNEERTTLFRFLTGGPIGGGLGAFGTRTLLVPSADHNLYALDVLTSDVKWTFASGAPIDQAPVVADDLIFVINTAGNLTSVDPESGSPVWTTATDGGRLLAVGASKIYLRSWAWDLLVIDRNTGKVLADPGATVQRAGLNLRELRLSFDNQYDDRMYFGSDSGLIVCVRELGVTEPRMLRDPKALPFGYIPPEGIRSTPPAPSGAEPTIETSLEPKAEARKAQPKEDEPKADEPKEEPQAEEPKDDPKS